MFIKSVVINCFIVSSFAWLAPERCSQTKKISFNPDAPTLYAQSVPDVREIAKKQHENLVQSYKDHEFFGVPIRAKANDILAYPGQIEVHTPYNCSFHTYDPRLLSSVACSSNVTCKLSHTVATTDSYTATEGYNWGVKISSKLSLFAKVFEIGGEASGGGSYTCTYTKGKTTTDSVECTDNSNAGEHLQLYTVKTDMVCDFGEVTFNRDTRNNKTSYEIYNTSKYFTIAELEEMRASVQVRLEKSSLFLLDMDKISNRMYQKFTKLVPTYNPYTDFILVDFGFIGVVYFKKASTVQEYRHVIPFTNEGGDSVYQYACTRVEF